MKKIIVGFSYRPGIFSNLINFTVKSKASHTYIRLPIPEHNEDMVFQASGFMVNYMNFKIFKEKAKVIEEYEIEVSDEVAKEGELLRITEVGKPYSMKEIFGLLVVLAARNLGFKIKNPLRTGSHSYICVELVMTCIGLKADSENVTQEDFRRWCVKNAKCL